MKGKEFYSVPYNARNRMSMKVVRMKCGGIVAFGRWQALLGMLYENDGRIDLSDEVMHKVTEAELELKGEQLDKFIDVLTEVGWVDLTLWQTSKTVACKGVTDQLEYQRTQSESGSKGGRGNRKSEPKSTRKSTAESNP